MKHINKQNIDDNSVFFIHTYSESLEKNIFKTNIWFWQKIIEYKIKYLFGIKIQK